MTRIKARGLLVIALAGALAAPGRAAIQPDEPLDVDGYAYLPGGQTLITIWGTHASLQPDSDNGLPHAFGGFSLYDDDFFAGGGFNVGVSSLEMEAGPQYLAQIVIDYGMGFLPLGGSGAEHRIDIFGVQGSLGPPVAQVEASIGAVQTDGSAIYWTGLEQDILGAGGIVTITFGDVVPAPPALWLVGIATLSMRRRRRHSTR